jgi:predicted nucleotide-binding protein
MKVFLSWSGSRSEAVARALHNWLPDVLQAVQPWFSSSDIQAGARWASELELQLRESRVGIICLTPENLTAPWVLFEAGALSKSIGSAYVCPYLFGFNPSELHGPLVQFQAIPATREGTRMLVLTLNRAMGENAFDEQRLDRVFDRSWPDLERALETVAVTPLHEKNPLEADREPFQSLLKEIGRTPPDNLVERLQQVIVALSGQQFSKRSAATVPSGRVFIIHGHNRALREITARFVEKLGPAVIILDEQPSSGRTIIEKFESYAEVHFAIALMTADDMGTGRAASEPGKLRARQNVVFELGFFTAKLGRSRLAVLHEEGVEMPSDFSGICYIPVDSAGAWKLMLAKELKTAGLQVDLNKAL